MKRTSEEENRMVEAGCDKATRGWEAWGAGADSDVKRNHTPNAAILYFA
jgi:hypothetical protein